MNFEEIESVWRSPHNQPSATELEQHKMKLITELRRRHRGFALFMTVVLAALVITTGKVLVHLVWPDPTNNAIDISREWAIIPLFAMPWVAWIHLVLQYRRHSSWHPDYKTSIQASLQALLDENRITGRRNVVTCCLQLGFLLMLPMFVYQLKAVGKAGSEINIMLAAVPILFACVMLGMAYNYWRKLLPRKRELEALLKFYKTETTTGAQ